ncbi:hypothetical protein [Nonomuraea ceibae]|uniref:hypothetical protein n=1 Tax=Nonomuraea ceibae TaxID=1935170 RepID=UPI001C5D0448|nr:hypothetical protein [Nonomuraea ceibae]
MATIRSVPPAPPAPEARSAPESRPPRDPVDVAVDACTRFAAHLVLLSHQLGEHGLDDSERERLAAALAIAERALDVATETACR